MVMNHLNMTKIYENTPDSNIVYETYIYTVRIGVPNVKNDGQTYHYTINTVDKHLLNGPFNFRVPKKNAQSHKYLLFGDMDSNWVRNVSGVTFDWIKQQIIDNTYYDAILFQGDMAYDLETNNVQQGENWLKNISQFTSHYPFMPTAGNHDEGKNGLFNYYRNNFITPTIQEYSQGEFYNEFYSFTLGCAHIIQFNPYLLIYNVTITEEQNRLTLNIIRQDLITANKSRDIVPWIIVYNHYPQYCSGLQDPQCQSNQATLNEYIQLFNEFKVDLYLSGHQHNYERDKPYYNGQLVDYEINDNIITKYGAPIQIIEGAGGTDYYMPLEPYKSLIYTDKQVVGPGIGILEVHNHTHIQFQHITTTDSQIKDSIWIIKSIHTDDDEPNIAKGFKYFIIGSVILVFTLIIIFGYMIIRKRKGKKQASFDEELNVQ